MGTANTPSAVAHVTQPGWRSPDGRPPRRARADTHTHTGHRAITNDCHHRLRGWERREGEEEERQLGHGGTRPADNGARMGGVCNV